MDIHVSLTAQDARRLLALLLVLEIGLVGVYGVDALVGPIRGIHSLSDLDRETAIPTWFSSVQLFFIGTLFVLMSRQRDVSPPRSRLFLLLVAAGFIWLSLDEAVAVHEKLTGLLKDIAWIPRFKGDHGIWILLYLPAGLILLFACRREIVGLWRQYRRETLIFGLGAGLTLTGAVGVEIASYLFARGEAAALPYRLEVALEEFLEMCGASIILYATLLLSLRRSQAAPLEVSSDPPLVS